jgi:hypothetical protein
VNSKVKQNLLVGEASPLERAGEANDEFVATLGDEVTRTLAKILKDPGAGSLARVGAGKALLEWIRPKKSTIIAINNSGASRHVSHLGLPEAQVAVLPQESPATPEAGRPPVIEPEPVPHMQAARLTSFEEIVDTPHAPAPPLLPERTKDPSPPAMPPKASTIKPYQ